mmetsp:Transcript_94744/g.173634  ORF Transcript_94744/g.173634 Transcript_94744/m.173634 type:complete len:204 (+) Transcript_94744:1348-1959(+)
MIEVDETCVLVINTCEKIRPSLRLLLGSAVTLCNCWRKTEAAWHCRSSFNKRVKVSRSHLTIKIRIGLGEAFQQELVQLLVCTRTLTAGSCLDEFDKTLLAVLCGLNALQLVKVNISSGWTRYGEGNLLRGTIWVPSLVHATCSRWWNTRQTVIKRACFLADVDVAKVQPCFEMDVATPVMHLVKLGLSSRCFQLERGVSCKC